MITARMRCAATVLEVIGAGVMLAAPRMIPGYVLLAASLILGGALHVLHGETPPAAFLVYLASIALVALMRLPVADGPKGGVHG